MKILHKIDGLMTLFFGKGICPVCKRMRTLNSHGMTGEKKVVLSKKIISKKSDTESEVLEEQSYTVDEYGWICSTCSLSQRLGRAESLSVKLEDIRNLLENIVNKDIHENK